jgi:peroxiredoxin (alkyl hydroperoxide reductase subunit C)
MSAFVGTPATDFSAEVYVNGEFKKISLADFRGKKVVLFFYPLDFTFVCPREILAFVDGLEDFRKRQTAVIGASVDSKFTHAAWARVDRKDGGSRA